MRELAGYQLPVSRGANAWFQPSSTQRPDRIAGLQLWLSGQGRTSFSELSGGSGSVQWDGDRAGRMPARNDAALVGTAAANPTDRRPQWVSDEVRGAALRFGTGGTASQLRGYGGSSALNFVHQTGEFTMAAHVRRRSSETQTLLTTNRGASSTRGFFWGTMSAAPDRLWFFITDGSTATHWYSGGTVPADDDWHFICVRGNGAEVQFCIDGVWEAPQPMGGLSAGDATSALEVGAYGATPTLGLNGALDDTVIYRRPLTDAEVAALRRYNVTGELIHPPSGYSHFYWADELSADGNQNTGWSVGDLVDAWHGHKANGAAVQDQAGYRPSLAEAPHRRQAVAFGIAEDRLEIDGSATSLAYLHQTGNFHAILLLRKDATVDMSPLASTNSSSERGCIVQLKSDGTVRGSITRGVSSQYLVDLTSSATLLPGVWSVIELFGSTADNEAGLIVGDADPVTGTLGETAEGDASRACWLGGRPASTPTGYFDGQLALVALWPRRLNSRERAAFRQQLTRIYGIA